MGVRGEAAGREGIVHAPHDQEIGAGRDGPHLFDGRLANRGGERASDDDDVGLVFAGVLQRFERMGPRRDEIAFPIEEGIKIDEFVIVDIQDQDKGSVLQEVWE